MENNLSINRLELFSLIGAYQPMADAVAMLANGSVPSHISLRGLRGSLPNFLISLYMTRVSGADCIIITPGQKEGDECESDIQTILGQDVDIYKLPWWGNMPYRSAAPGSSVFGERASFLAHLTVRSPAGKKGRVFIVPQRAMLTPLPPPEYERKLLRRISRGQVVDTQVLSKDLVSFGYVRVPRVTIRGEFALRGEVLDIFMPGDKSAYRVLFDFDTIDQIKAFDPETQGTNSKDAGVESLVLYPMKEVIWDDGLCANLEEILKKEDREGVSSENSVKTVSSDVHLGLTDEGKAEKERILTELSVNGSSEGEELFYGSLWDRQYGLVDYIMEETPVFFLDWDRQMNAVKMIRNEYTAAYRLARQRMPALRPKDMLLDYESNVRYISNSIFFHTVGTDILLENPDIDGLKELSVPSQDGQSFLGNINYFKESLTSLRQNGYKIFIFADNPNQSLRINELLKDFTTEEGGFPVKIEPLSLTAGFSIESEKILVVQENEIFGRKKAAPASIRRVKSKVIDNFVELNPGDYIVHANYGIGLFKGIERVKSLGTERDYIKLEYADKDYIFVPIEQVNMVQRYIGNEGGHPQLDHIGSKSWKNRKDKVQKKVEEMAEKLIDLYSKRQASRGFPFPRDGEWQTAFEAAFPYEDTPDQMEASRDIKEDMERPVPMDRLLCGDVGYGKTEVAMRAAFKAVMGGKQVAFLAPTTILADQHYESCVERFKNFPVHIAMLSRFVAPAEQKKIIAALAQGKVDILVGTHRIIQKDIIYKDLGLMIIDEEQRFGVKDKEKLKTLKTNIDCLAMSATPIPRTLHMSLLKIRDMSLLTTPPQNRQPIETSIEPFSGSRIAMAIRREVERGGQVFYLHNRVENLLETRIELEKLVPEMLIDVAHGQMSSEELDDIFHRFKMGGFHVLIATTIIENGIDIPNVNTIIIDRADMYGVSQLYQLRGRVGRSDRKAYAYLFYPENKALSDVAMRRLQVISDFTELGSGFKIAMKDMEIRGAGNLLGRDQSGEVYAVGFEMYLSLLNDAIKRLSGSGWQAPDETLLELEYTGFIPDAYISDAQIKMELYKKIAAIGTQGELDAIYGELQDRFGPVPDEVNSLLCLAKIRILCHRLSIISLREKQGDVRVEFGSETKVNVDKILSLIKRNPSSVRLDSMHPNQLLLRTNSIELNTKSEFIRDKLEQLIG